MQNANANSARIELSLRELATQIKQSIAASFTDYIWVRAETSDLRTHSSGTAILNSLRKTKLTKKSPHA